MARFSPAILALTVAAVVSAGCSADFQPRAQPAVVGHMQIAKKQEYIQNTKATLKNFQASARDLRARNKPLILEELSGEVHRYIRLRVVPIVNDFEAENNLETRLEIAKLQLLSGLVYFELGEVRKVRQLLREMDRRYQDPSFLSSAIDSQDIGFSTIGEGMQALRGRLATGQTPPPAGNPMLTPRV
ncbi:MAG: hypothetical protein IH614_17795 [Desulfuromonadales bacterium]|nr:hypothetical protein [Desulfuromonadales bacterium]